VVVAYGQLLSAGLLEIPSLGAVNVHASLLPRYRGPAPIQWAIINGETQTGVTTILMDAGMDTGDVLLTACVDINPEDTAGSLQERLATKGAEVLVQTLERLKRGTLVPRAQDHSRATHAPLLTPKDGEVNWQEEGRRICWRIRGLDPWPGAFTRWGEKRLKLFDCLTMPGGGENRPGTVLAIDALGLHVATGDGVVCIQAVQPEGRRRLPVAEFVRGYTVTVGTVFGE
jgi:methionyl-tRNA formyltransferase